MEDEEDMGLPFWLQTTDRRRGQAFYIFLNSGTLLIVLLVVAFIFVFILVPSFVSFTSQIFRPHLIKKSWDYLNFVLVFFAILCGFLSRNNNNNSNSKRTSSRSISSVQQDLQRHYPSTHAVNSFNRLRSFSSYPDLRQESLWLNNDERWRFYDDTHLHSYRFPSSSDQVQDHRPQQQYQAKADQDEDSLTKDIDVDISLKEVVYTPPPSSPLPPPQSPSAPPLSSLLPPPKAVRRKVKSTYQDLGHEKREEKDLKVEKFYIPQTSPAPTPPPPPPVFNKNEKRRGKGFLNSLRIKKKKQSQKSVENLQSFFDPHHPSSLPSIPLPPPPPPSNFFQNLFSSNKGKSKKVHSLQPPPPLPPPPVTSSSSTRVSTQNVTQSPESRASSTTTAQVAAVTPHQVPKTVNRGSPSRVEENMETGNASYFIPIPPPPPPPPFKITSWKFVRVGDYVRVASFNSWRSGLPDLDSEDPSDKESSLMARKDKR